MPHIMFGKAMGFKCNRFIIKARSIQPYKKSETLKQVSPNVNNLIIKCMY